MKKVTFTFIVSDDVLENEISNELIFGSYAEAARIADEFSTDSDYKVEEYEG